MVAILLLLGLAGILVGAESGAFWTSGLDGHVRAVLAQGLLVVALLGLVGRDGSDGLMAPSLLAGASKA